MWHQFNFILRWFILIYFTLASRRYLLCAYLYKMVLNMDQITIYRVQRLSVTVVVLYCTYSIVDLLDPRRLDL